MDGSRGRRARIPFGTQIVLVFVASAVVPILAFSWLAYTSTRDQLEADGGMSLQRDAKSAAMSIVERINTGASQLEVAGLAGPAKLDASGDVFISVERISRTQLTLAPQQAAHLDRGRFLLMRASDSPTRPLQLLKGDDTDILVGTFEPDYLYGPDRIGGDERYWVTDDRGDLLFSAAEDGRTAQIVEDLALQEVRKPFDLDAASGSELAVIWPLFLKNPYLSSQLLIGISRSHESIQRPLREFRSSVAAALLLAILVSTGIAMYQIRQRVGPLRELVDTTRRIRDGDLAARSNVRSGDEFEVLAASINRMSSTLESNFRTVERLRSVADTLLSANDRASVRERVVPVAVGLVDARDGQLFVLDGMGRKTEASLYEVRDETSPRPPDDDATLRFAELAQAGSRPQIFLRERDDHAGWWDSVDSRLDTTCEAILSVPIVSGAGRVVGVLQLLFADGTSRTDQITEMYPPLRILAAQTGAALHTVAHIEDLRGLFEGVIQLTVDAIDKKSAYTGDHCRRVPILSQMITDAACEEDIGPLKDFSLTHEERYELQIAALLHDCGKVSTPVHVMDKATKLEAIIDRVELIQTRMEVLVRDRELDALRSKLSSVDPAWLEARPWVAERTRLEDDLRFLQFCNIGGESMTEAAQREIDDLRQRHRWTDRHGVERSLLTEDEAMNLKISRGTLNDQEREIINDHVTTTMQLLEPLPFPPELKNVPSIAGAHHERIDGTGYPKGLGAENLSMQGRILALADIFEALTAKDRPYKRGKSLSETLDILESMADEGHIDPDLHEMFVRRKLYLRYAAENVEPDQIDEPHRLELEILSAPWDSTAPPLTDSPSR